MPICEDFAAVETATNLATEDADAWQWYPACDGYSVVLFGPTGLRYRHPPAALLDEIKSAPGVSSIQITFREHLPPEHHAMPPGGFRLAIVNGFDLAAARAARERLKGQFFPQPQRRSAAR